MESRLWLSAVANQLQGGREDRCEFGHEYHERIQVTANVPGTTDQLSLTVFNWLHHATDKPGYCTGRDEVSKGLMSALSWEADDTLAIIDMLHRPRPNEVVIDVGSHIGWFTLVAMLYGYDCLAIDADPEHLEVLKLNVIKNFPSSPRPFLCRGWVDDNSIPVEADEDVFIKLLKIDIEGNELSALRVFEPMFKVGQVGAVLIEVNPGGRTEQNFLEAYGLSGRQIRPEAEGQQNWIYTR